MAEVDYSKFYYKRERTKENGTPVRNFDEPERDFNATERDFDEPKRDYVATERDFDEPKRDYVATERNFDTPRFETHKRGETERVKAKRSKKPLLVLITLIVIFAIIFFAADFFTNGKLLDTVTASLRGNSYEYYFVVTETGGRDLAYAKSLLIKQMGGSGFIIDEKNKFLVVLSVYPDKSEAAAVSAKNPNTYVYTLGFTSKNTDFFNTVDKAVSDISAALKNLESGLISESECYGSLLSVKGEIVKLKAKILESGNASELNLLEYIIGGIDGLEMGKGTRLNFLSDARYVLCGIISSMPTIETRK